MGLKSMLFGKKPKFVERSAGERRLLDQARSDLAATNQMSPGARAFLAAANDDGPETRRARATANADVMQATSGAGFDPANPNRVPADRALTRAKALARMGWAGAEQAKEGGFYSRLGLAQFGKAAKRGQQAADSTLSGIEYNHRATDNYLSAVKGATAANVLGTLGGAGLAAYSEHRRKN